MTLHRQVFILTETLAFETLDKSVAPDSKYGSGKLIFGNNNPKLLRSTFTEITFASHFDWILKKILPTDYGPGHNNNLNQDQNISNMIWVFLII